MKIMISKLLSYLLAGSVIITATGLATASAVAAQDISAETPTEAIIAPNATNPDVSGNVQISGTISSGEGQNVTVIVVNVEGFQTQIRNQFKSIDDVKAAVNNDITQLMNRTSYVHQVTSSEGGRFTFDAQIEKLGLNFAFISGTGVESRRIEIYIGTQQAKSTAVEAINAADRTSIGATLAQFKDMLHIELESGAFAFLSQSNKDQVLSQVANTSFASVEDVKNAFETACRAKVREEAIAGDANLDGKVDVRDMMIIILNNGMADAKFAAGDINNDGKVSVEDVRQIGLIIAK